jgi:hypothetical protein
MGYVEEYNMRKKYEPYWLERPVEKNLTYCKDCEFVPEDFNNCGGCAWVCLKGYTIFGMDYYKVVRCRDFRSRKNERYG